MEPRPRGKKIVKKKKTWQHLRQKGGCNHGGLEAMEQSVCGSRQEDEHRGEMTATTDRELSNRTIKGPKDTGEQAKK